MCRWSWFSGCSFCIHNLVVAQSKNLLNNNNTGANMGHPILKLTYTNSTSFKMGCPILEPDDKHVTFMQNLRILQNFSLLQNLRQKSEILKMLSFPPSSPPLRHPLPPTTPTPSPPPPTAPPSSATAPPFHHSTFPIQNLLYPLPHSHHFLPRAGLLFPCRISYGLRHGLLNLDGGGFVDELLEGGRGEVILFLLWEFLCHLF